MIPHGRNENGLPPNRNWLLGLCRINSDETATSTVLVLCWGGGGPFRCRNLSLSPFCSCYCFDAVLRQGWWSNLVFRTFYSVEPVYKYGTARNPPLCFFNGHVVRAYFAVLLGIQNSEYYVFLYVNRLLSLVRKNQLAYVPAHFGLE